MTTIGPTTSVPTLLNEHPEPTGGGLPAGMSLEAQAIALELRSSEQQRSSARDAQRNAREAQQHAAAAQLKQMREAADERYGAARIGAITQGLSGALTAGAQLSGASANGKAWFDVVDKAAGAVGGLWKAECERDGSAADIRAQAVGNEAQRDAGLAEDAADAERRAADRSDRVMQRLEQVLKARDEARMAAIRG